MGGWYDAGDFDLRTQTQTRVILDPVHAREEFGLNSDDTSVNEAAREVEMRKPDGLPDVVQQVRHGVLLLLAEHHVIGHAIPGIIEPRLEEDTYLGDAASKTDVRIYSEPMGRLESDGIYSGVPDDRWAFTSHTTALSYDEVGALAAASRALRGFDDKTAEECLEIAEMVWAEEHKQAPALFQDFNTTGSNLRHAEVEAAVELLISNRREVYRQRLKNWCRLLVRSLRFWAEPPLVRFPLWTNSSKRTSPKDWRRTNQTRAYAR